MHRRWVVTPVVLSGLAGLVGTVLAQTQRPTVFRTETNYVEVDAVVTDADGQFVPGLTVADFELREQRQRQSIETFASIDLPIGPTAVSTTPAPVRFRPDLLPGERVAADRIYLIYLNGASQPTVRQRAIEFVRDFMQPRDLAAIWDAEVPSPSLLFTDDRAALLRELEHVVSYSRAPSSAERGRVEGQRLRDAIDWLGAMQGRRKSLILFTQGWTIATSVGGGRGGAGSGVFDREREVTDWLQGRRPGLFTGGTWLNPTDITDRADVHIYSFDARGLAAARFPPNTTNSPDKGDTLAAPDRAESQSNDLLRSIADQTGGRAFVESNDYRRGFARIVEDNSRYYILGYYSPNAKRDGVFRALDVRVTRPGLKVRARNGYVAR